MKQILLYFIITLLTINFAKAQSDYETNGIFQFVEELPVQKGLLYGPGRLDAEGKSILIGMDDENTGLTHIYTIDLNDLQKPVLIKGKLNNTTMSIYQPTMDRKRKSLIVVASTSDSWSDNDLYESHKNIFNKYSKIKKLNTLNSDSLADAYPMLIAGGTEIYFTRDNQLFFSKRASVHTEFEAAKAVHFANDGYAYVMSVWVSEDGKELFYSTSSGTIYHAKKNAYLSFDEPELFTDEFTDFDFIASISFDNTMKNLWLYLSDNNNLSHILHYRLK